MRPRITANKRLEIQSKITTTKRFFKDYKTIGITINEKFLPKWAKDFIQFCKDLEINDVILEKVIINKVESSIVRKKTLGDYIIALERVIKPKIKLPKSIYFTIR